MQSKLSGIFRVKLIAKNITELSLQCDVFLKKHTSDLNQAIKL